MNITYTITGMTCGGCAAKVKSAFLKNPDVLSVEVSHQEGTTKVQAERMPDRKQLDKLLADAGEYRITEVADNTASSEEKHSKTPILPEEETTSIWETYKPLVLIFLFVSGVAAAALAEKERPCCRSLGWKFLDSST